jgi:hypothetical protein
MIHHRRPSITPVRTRLRRSRPHLSQGKKNKSPFPRMLILPDRSSVAAYLSAPFPTARCRVTAHALSPSPARSAPSLPTPLTYVLVTCAARSLVYPSPIVVGRAANPAMAVGAHVPWRLRSSPTKPRAPTSVAGAGGARTLRLATGPTPTTGLGLPLPYIANMCLKCFRCFRGML